MKGQMCFGLVALLEVLVSVLAADKQTYVEVDRSLSLSPPEASSDHISNIVWKHNGNLVLEWVEGKVDLEFYGTFKGRSKLDTTNARLEVNDMTKADSGIYTAEINNVVQSDRYDVKVISAVPVPEVQRQPLICGTGSDKDNCTLACNGLESIEEAKPITYSWKRDGQMLQDTTTTLNITNDEETRRVKTYSCLMKNPVSEKESKAYDNPFFKEPEPPTGLIVGMIVAILILILASLAVVKRESIRSWLNRLQTGKSDAPDGNKPVEDASDGNKPGETNKLMGKNAETPLSNPG